MKACGAVRVTPFFDLVLAWNIGISFGWLQTENQFARLIGATPLQIDLQLIRMSSHETKNTAAEHMATFYRPFQDVKAEKFDGLIITGAPIEHERARVYPNSRRMERETRFELATCSLEGCRSAN